METIASGEWSDVNVWDEGRIPIWDDTVEILGGHVIHVGPGAIAGETNVLGDLRISLGGTLDLYGSLIIRGSLHGSVGEIRFHVEDDRLFIGNDPTNPGPDPDMPEFVPGDIGLWCLDGSTVELEGPPVTPWLNATIEGNSVWLSEPGGWELGDKLLLCGVEGNYALADLVSIDGGKISFSGAESFETTVMTIEGRTVYPKVANLSRRFKIIAADVTEENPYRRAHTIYMEHMEKVVIRNVEFRNLGVRGKLGRYPVHLHHLHPDEFSPVVDGCSIWQSTSHLGSRFIAIHDTMNAIITNNVGLKSQGHGYFMEEGRELYTALTGNLSVDVRSPEELKVAESNFDGGSYHFWVKARNTIRGNVAVGPTFNPLVDSNRANFVGGLIVKRHLFKSLSTANTEIIGQEIFGGDIRYGLATTVDGTTFKDCTVCYCRSSATNGDVGTANNTKFINLTALFNRESQLGVYSSPGTVLSDCLFVGNVILFSRYANQLSIYNSKFKGKVFASEMTDLGCYIDTCDFQVQSLFEKRTGKQHDRFEPLVRIVNCTGVPNGDYTGIGCFFGYPGTENTKTKNLDAPAPVSGFLKMPAMPFNSRYEVVATGEPFTGLINLRDAGIQKQWVPTNATLGYPFGLPPGSYDVRTVDSKTLITTKKRCLIEAWKVTDFVASPDL